jgi:hypothetical protein
MPGGKAEIVRRLVGANRSGPASETREVALTIVDPDGEFRSRINAVEGGVYPGHNGVHRYYDDMAGAFREWHNEIEELTDIGPHAVLGEITFHGVGNDSGMEVELTSAALFVFSGSRVTRLLIFPTREEALAEAERLGASGGQAP